MEGKIGFIGLGAMGQPMSRRLLEAGFRVVAYDLRPEAVEALVQKGGEGCFFGQRSCGEMPEGHHRSELLHRLQIP
jgi:6-phosphogluconate dehydrogenase (decarboxylating)